MEEVLEFTDSNIEWLATEYEETIALDEKAREFSQKYFCRSNIPLLNLNF